MRRTFTIAAITAALALTACGSDDSSGGDLSGPQADAAQAAIDSAAEGGITLDRDCVNEVAAQLSDEDAELAAAGDDAELSPEGEALTVQLVGCADQDELVDAIIGSFGDVGAGFDEDCARDALKELDLTALVAASGDEPPAELVDALTPCFGG
jgi:hypothetical protein